MNPVQAAQIYGFPFPFGTGQSIAILELGGGYAYSDVTNFWTSIGLTPPFSLTFDLSVNGGSNSPSSPPSPDDWEVNLDIAIAGAVAQGAAIFVLFCSSDATGLAMGIQNAVALGVYVISISWAALENGSDGVWSSSDIQTIHEQLELAAYSGVTVLCASGDIPFQVQYPGSDPYVLACGGTDLSSTALTAVETTWSGSSGGVSAIFPTPCWQSLETPWLSVNILGPTPLVTGRGTPDVAGYANGYVYSIAGNSESSSGTSTVAPLYAGLIAVVNLLNANSGWGYVGYLNPLLYAAASPSLVRETSDETEFDLFPLDFGWNSSTGLGSLRGISLLSAIGGARLAMVWKGIEGDQGMYSSVLGQGVWSPQRILPGLESTDGPSLSNSIMVWKSATDRQIFYSMYDGVNWRPGQKLVGAESSLGPTVSELGIAWLGSDSQIYQTGSLPSFQPNEPPPTISATGIFSGDAPSIADDPNLGFIYTWRGQSHDNSLYWAPYQPEFGWGPTNSIPLAQSEVRPAIASSIRTIAGDPVTYRVAVCLVFNQGNVGFWTTFDGSSWTTPLPVPGALLEGPPALTAFENVFYLTWKSPWEGIYWSAFDGTLWTPPRIIPEVATGASPCIDASSESGLVLAWKGEQNDNSLYWSNSGGFNGKQWGLQTSVPGFGTSTGAAMAALNGSVVMIWKGVEGDDSLWFATQTGSQLSGGEWSAQQKIGSGAATSACPACVSLGNSVLAVWKGANDQSIYHAEWDGSSWQALGTISDFQTGTSPALTFDNTQGGIVLMAWKGAGNDETVWYASRVNGVWNSKSAIPGAGTSQSPAVATLNPNVVLAAWRGISDQNIWYCQITSTEFTTPATIPIQNSGVITSSVGPALIAVGQVIYMLWKGMDSDQGIYSSIWDGVSWSYPQAVKGAGTSFRPALVVVPVL